MKWRWLSIVLVAIGAAAFALVQMHGGHSPTVATAPSKEQAMVPVARPKRASRPRRSRTPSTGTRASQVAPTSQAPATVSSPQSSQPLARMTISVDPGHNGGNFTHPEEIARLVPAGVNGTTKACNTTGTETNDGTLTEAQFNWDVAQDLVRRLEELGARVVLTRHSNEGVGPCVNQRAEIANRAHAAAAVSIHADGNYTEGARGFDVIHATTEEMVAPNMAASSLRLAASLRNALAAAGVPPANYVGSNGLDARSDLAGLNLARVPAALVELGNMREAGEAAKLESPAYRSKLANALAAGIVAFLGRG